MRIQWSAALPRRRAAAAATPSSRRPPLVERDPEVAAQDPAQPPAVLLEQRTIEPELPAQALALFARQAVVVVEVSGVARYEAEEEEDDRQDEQEEQQRGGQTPQEEARQGASGVAGTRGCPVQPPVFELEERVEHVGTHVVEPAVVGVDP